MTTQEKAGCMYVGIDVHKDTHTQLVSLLMEKKMFEITIGNRKRKTKSQAVKGKYRLIEKI